MARQSFTVQHVTRRSTALSAGAGVAPGYNSKPGDARRQGRSNSARVGGGMQSVVITFHESSAEIEARLGVVRVGSVTHDVAAGDYLWSVYLSEMSRVPRRARSSDAAKEAIAHKVREWCEAARVITVRGAR